MKNGIILGLLIIVLILVILRTTSSFHCEDDETPRDDVCVSNSYKTRWWAFWEAPKCKRGKMQDDYTCIAERIWDAAPSSQAVQAPSQAVQAPSPPKDIQPRPLDIQPLIQVIQKLVVTGPPTDYTLDIAINDSCPFNPNGTISTTVSGSVQSIDAQTMNEFRQALMNVFQDPQISNAVSKIEPAEVMEMINTTINTENKRIKLPICNGKFPLNAQDPTVLVPTIIAVNMIAKVENSNKPESCPKAAVMTLDASGNPNGVLTGPGMTITRGTTDTYLPGKVRLYAPIVIDGRGKTSGTSFHTELRDGPCEGTVVEIGDWAQFDVKKIMEALSTPEPRRLERREEDGWFGMGI